jgi:hypothetical protein
VASRRCTLSTLNQEHPIGGILTHQMVLNDFFIR